MIQELIKLIYKVFKYLFGLAFRRKPTMQLGEIGTHKDLQEKYQLYAENRPEIKLNRTNVPKDLQDLIPMAEKWGISDDIIRSDFEEKAKRKEKEELKEKLVGRHDSIQEWLDTFEDDHMTDEAEAFLYMTLAYDEMQLYQEH